MTERRPQSDLRLRCRSAPDLASEFDEREQASQGHDDDEGNGNGDTV